ncbi:MAG: DUF502 domain-containing protein [Cytophagaceae bacterium]|jgi:uncharacterized membrane protein|nr:DUF502 domain-containing protein [Cytophagaceae bacterium]
MKYLLRYFLNGLLLVLPASFTIYIVFSLLNWLNKSLNSLIAFDLPKPVETFLTFPGVTILILLTLITLLGLLGTSLVARPAFKFLENYIYKVPLINLIYSSTKDLISAFVGDKKKFNHPVLVRMHKNDEIYRLGFLTRDNLQGIGAGEMVAVYFPDSYGFTGNLYVMPASNIVKELDIPAAEVMKLIVSGGVSGGGLESNTSSKS